jgi:hypothetical protein
MAQANAVPKPGDVKACSECGQMTAVYKRVDNSLFVLPAQAAYPGRLPDIYAWTCSHCGHEDRDPPIQVHTEPEVSYDPNHH